MQFPTLQTRIPARLFLIVLIASVLFSCGQKGPLQRPGQAGYTITAADTTSVS
ncbi:MAG: lipoprotein [Gammaproteobacteria bacterium]|nr:lipoprotein [Gammaproteobacteria bacterium]MDP2141600.1 lipoprotein [Gammaproteobacteria bacterium]MDP2346645.1 lipoprotein [Gammaproteobacteria bacterium]